MPEVSIQNEKKILLAKKEVKSEIWCILPPPLKNIIKEYFTPILIGVYHR